jgi:hypothetical protein
MLKHRDVEAEVSARYSSAFTSSFSPAARRASLSLVQVSSSCHPFQSERTNMHSQCRRYVSRTSAREFSQHCQCAIWSIALVREESRALPSYSPGGGTIHLVPSMRRLLLPNPISLDRSQHRTPRGLSLWPECAMEAIKIPPLERDVWKNSRIYTETKHAMVYVDNGEFAGVVRQDQRGLRPLLNRILLVSEFEAGFQPSVIPYGSSCSS